jgi:excisionase family DNA binding protein
MPILASPVLLVGRRDAAWVAEVLDDLIERHYFASTPAIAERATMLAAECREVLTGGQQAPERYLTFKQAAMIGCVSLSTIRRRVRAGVLPVVRDGGVVRVRESDVRALLEAS